MPDLEPVLENQHAPSFHAGLERASQAGFDLEVALAHDSGLEMAEAQGYAAKVLEVAAGISRDLDLDEHFFDRPANTVLLTAIAESWVTTEDQAQEHSHDRGKISDRRAALADAALILAGASSGVARDLAADSIVYRDRYLVKDDKTDPDAVARDEFLESIGDPELAAEISTVFDDGGEDSFLQKERVALGVTQATEKPYDIKVLKMSDKYSLQQVGMLEKIEWPDWSNVTDDTRAQAKAASAKQEEQDAHVAPYKTAKEEYERRFADKFGELPPAFVRRNPDGANTLFLQAHDAYAILNYFRDGRPMPEDDFVRRSIEDRLAIAKHEYAHTQKKLTVGPHSQLGLLLEERKAELVSGDKHGYKDTKDFIMDLSLVAGIGILDTLGDAVRQEDALSAFVVRAANELGLKDTLMLVLDKPLPYDKDPDRASKFVDLSSLRQSGDTSVHDAGVRDSLARKGDGAIQERSRKWVEAVIGNGTDPDFLKGFFFGYRRNSGSAHGTKYLEQALDAYLARKEQSKGPDGE